jgi:hypothetical protein
MKSVLINFYCLRLRFRHHHYRLAILWRLPNHHHHHRHRQLMHQKLSHRHFRRLHSLLLLLRLHPLIPEQFRLVLLGSQMLQPFRLRRHRHLRLDHLRRLQQLLTHQQMLLP